MVSGEGSASRNGTRLPTRRVLIIMYAFAVKFSYYQTIRECDEINVPDIAESTIADWFSNLREVCRGSLDRRYNNQPNIGGPNHVVEIDACKIGRNKFEAGRLVEDSWVLGMIDRQTKEVRLEICPNNKRNIHTLFRLIRKHVAAQSTIMTDCWKGYEDLTVHNFRHLAENYSLNFVDPMSGASTNLIKSSWRPLKQRLCRGGVRKDDLSDHLCEYLWRQDCSRLQRDPFDAIIEDIKVLYPGGLSEDSDDGI
ncbi:uncharacterized protein [Periplaneta americana]|uniref:uncharacterized protein isoform X2 n=1 Tax=Periplaneta americana TaxID=6978 RepID=UPI0037E755CF